MGVLDTFKNEEDSNKNEAGRVFSRFTHYYPVGAICCHGNQSNDHICF